MSWWSYAPYVPVAERKARALREAKKLAGKGSALEPVALEGRTIARTFWGKAWCSHLESFSDYANRLPRGRSYLANGLVVDLKIGKGSVTALVSGSELYRVDIRVETLASKRWTAIRSACAGRIDSLVELLQGRLSDEVMRPMCDREHGLFPGPREIRVGCSCPDHASMCKHVAASLYGVAARLDRQPELLFALRGVDHVQLVQGAVKVAPRTAPARSALAGEDLSALFGIDLAQGVAPAPSDTDASTDLFTPGERVDATDLAAIGIPRRTVRAWISKGLLERTSERDVWRATPALNAAVLDALPAD
jgi:uncharacterized Zn finger protein